VLYAAAVGSGPVTLGQTLGCTHCGAARPCGGSRHETDPQGAAQDRGGGVSGDAARPARVRRTVATADRRDEHARVPDRPGARDPALPGRLGGAQPARSHAPQAPRRELRERVHQLVHVHARPRHADDRPDAGAARRQVHARGGDAGLRGLPPGRAAGGPAEPRHGDECRRLPQRLQGQVALQQGVHARGSGEVRLRPLGPAGRRRQPRPRPGRRREGESRRPLHRGGRRCHRRRRRRAAVPGLRGRAGAAVLHGDLAGQPARRALLSAHLRGPPATTTPGSRERSTCPRRSARTCRPSRRCSGSSGGSSTSAGRCRLRG
jgi:hypothetical protein